MSKNTSKFSWHLRSCIRSLKWFDTYHSLFRNQFGHAHPFTHTHSCTNHPYAIVYLPTVQSCYVLREMSVVLCFTLEVREALCFYRKQNNLRKLGTIIGRLQRAAIKKPTAPRLQFALWPDERSMSHCTLQCSRKQTNKTRDTKASCFP